MKQKILFRTGRNRIFCVPGSIQEWGRRVSQDLIFSFLMLIKGTRRRGGFRIFLRDPRDGEILVKSSVR